MPFNLSGVKERQVVGKKAELKSDNNQDYKYKILYPFQVGKLKIRLLYNPASDIIYREIFRHDLGEGQDKVTCPKTWGQPCLVDPVLDDIEQISQTKMWKKRSKLRGISFAQVVSADYDLDNEIKPNDIVLLMYPKTVLEDLIGILEMPKTEDDLRKIIAENDGYVIEINHFLEKKFHRYSASLQSFETHKVVDLGDVAKEEKQFEDLLNNLEPLMEQLGLSDEISEEALTAEEELREDLESRFLRPKDPNARKERQPASLSTSPKAESSDAPKISEEDIPDFPIVPPATISTDDMERECFGSFNMAAYEDNNCIVCKVEPQCRKKTKALSES